MLVRLKNDHYEIDILNISNGNVFIDQKKINIKDVGIAIEGSNGEELDMGKLYLKLEKINKKYKLEDYLIVINKNFENIEVEVQHSKDKIHGILITIGYKFIKDFTEDELLVYLAHEIGHILDFNFTVRKHTYLKSAKVFGAIMTIIGLPALYYYQYGLNEYYQIKLFLVLLSWIAIYAVFLKYLSSFLTRLQEYHADSNAVEILGDVEKVIVALTTLQYELEEYEEKSSIFSTHPSLTQRMRYLRQRYFYHYILKFLHLK